MDVIPVSLIQHQNFNVSEREIWRIVQMVNQSARGCYDDIWFHA